jgi:hypothetical protein
MRIHPRDLWIMLAVAALLAIGLTTIKAARATDAPTPEQLEDHHTPPHRTHGLDAQGKLPAYVIAARDRLAPQCPGHVALVTGWPATGHFTIACSVAQLTTPAKP